MWPPARSPSIAPWAAPSPSCLYDDEGDDLLVAAQDVDEDLRRHVLPDKLMDEHELSVGMEPAFVFCLPDVEAPGRLQDDVDLCVDEIGQEPWPVVFR